MAVPGKSSYCGFNISRIPPSEFEDMIIAPFVKLAVERGGINLGGNVKFRKDNGGNWTELLIPTGGSVKFSHLYTPDGRYFKEPHGGIQIFAGANTGVSPEQMENTLREFAAYCHHELGIQCNIVEQKGGGCYIATAVYGSYDCPQVWVLRRYRDNSLAQKTRGRLFIKFYYAASPVAVKLFGQSKWFNSFWRGRLDRWVSELQEKGYKDSPYYG